MSGSVPTPVTEETRGARIRKLSTLVANQIAAGEVVERPASVVKEVVENSLDAKSTRVIVELETGGIELVRVTDDGGGIAKDDLPLAIAPHATSKISEANDLEHVGTLGFRGEALASISSVSRLTIRSRTKDSDSAYSVDVEGETQGTIKPAGGPVGTVVTVRNLFFNTPARRKFLRTPQTEQDRCVDVMKQLSMAHPDVGFVVKADGRTVIDVPPGQGPKSRCLAILGTELADQVVEVHADGFDDNRGIAVWGLAGLPSIARGSAKYQFVFVNGRPVRDRTITHALMEAYRGIIEPGRYPTVVLMLELSPHGVDVNVHPAKAEVRFRDSGLVHSVVLRALREALQRADLTPTALTLRPQLGGAGAAWTAANLGQQAPVDSQLLPGQAWRRDMPGAGVGTGWSPSTPADAAASERRYTDYFQRFSPAREQQGLNVADLRDALGGASAVGPSASGLAPSAEPTLPEAIPATRLLQVHNSYLVTQDEQGVVIIDQHALHERVMFEYLLARVTRPREDGTPGVLESQRLLMPVVAPCSPGVVESIEAFAPVFERIGVQAEPLTPTSLAVHAFPSFLFERGVDPVEFMGELFGKLDAGSVSANTAAKTLSEEVLRDVLDMMACKAAVKAGDKLSEMELDELVKLRSDVERSSNCPHGRPTSVRLTIRELEKLFGRS